MMKPIATVDKHPIARQTEVYHPHAPDQLIIWTHWRDGRITQQIGDDGEVIQIDFAPCRKVDHNSYTQWVHFFTTIAEHEYKMSYSEAVMHRLLPPRPETIDERRARAKKWWEKQEDRRVAIQAKNKADDSD